MGINSFFRVEPLWTLDLEFFFTQRPFLTSVVFLTLHDNLLTTGGRRSFHCFCVFYVMSSNVGDTM